MGPDRFCELEQSATTSFDPVLSPNGLSGDLAVHDQKRVIRQRFPLPFPRAVADCAVKRSRKEREISYRMEKPIAADDLTDTTIILGNRK